jgi:hypothetical protein
MTNEFSRDIEHILIQQAQGLGYANPSDYLKSLLGMVDGGSGDVTDKEFERILADLGVDDLVSLPASFSRADVYADGN